MTIKIDFTACGSRREVAKNWVLIPLLGAMTISSIMEWDQVIAGQYQIFLQSILISFVFWSSLANGNGIIIKIIDQYWSWLEHPVKRILIGFVAMLIYSTLASFIIIYGYIWIFIEYTFLEIMASQGWFSLLQIPLSITVVISLWEHGKTFFMEWRQAAIDIEILKTENIKSKFETLKSQVNPHFLFNSLNALSSLVYVDQDKAADFIKKLSDVYRYVLDHQEDELVPLSKEVGFLKSFVFLNKIRFGDNLKVEFINLDTTDDFLSLPPITLQMLVENCLKHNEISKKKPLHITIELKKSASNTKHSNGYITVINNVNIKLVSETESTGLGLNNIKARYKILSNQSIDILSDEHHFEVKIPLLTLPQ